MMHERVNQVSKMNLFKTNRRKHEKFNEFIRRIIVWAAWGLLQNHMEIFCPPWVSLENIRASVFINSHRKIDSIIMQTFENLTNNWFCMRIKSISLAESARYPHQLEAWQSEKGWKILLALAENLTRRKISFHLLLCSVRSSIIGRQNCWPQFYSYTLSFSLLLFSLKMILLYTHNPQKHVFSSIKEDLKGKQKHLKGLEANVGRWKNNNIKTLSYAIISSPSPSS